MKWSQLEAFPRHSNHYRGSSIATLSRLNTVVIRVNPKPAFVSERWENEKQGIEPFKVGFRVHFYSSLKVLRIMRSTSSDVVGDMVSRGRALLEEALAY